MKYQNGFDMAMQWTSDKSQAAYWKAIALGDIDFLKGWNEGIYRLALHSA